MTESNPMERKSSLRERRDDIHSTERGERIMKEIKSDYHTNGHYQVIPVKHRNVMLIGRTRSGKSAVKSLLIDPTFVSDPYLSFRAGVILPVFESFQVRGNQTVFNIIDTPGLFERGTEEIGVRDNKTILNTIEFCANREITKFHVVCFCVPITNGINQEDIESLKLLIKFFGREVSKNSCLIITRCESIGENQRENLRRELLEDNYFKEIAAFFQLGMYFSGSINRDDFSNGDDRLYDQFFTISEYRTKLIELFTSDIEPFSISETLISLTRRYRDEELQKEAQSQHLQVPTQEHTRRIQELMSEEVPKCIVS